MQLSDRGAALVEHGRVQIAQRERTTGRAEAEGAGDIRVRPPSQATAPYWPIDQVSGMVAVSPWSAFVALGSSWTVIT